MTKQEQRRMRSLENKIAYRTSQIKAMRDAADASAVRMLDKADTDAKRAHAKQVHSQRLADIAKTELTWLGPLEAELAELMEKLLDE